MRIAQMVFNVLGRGADAQAGRTAAVEAAAPELEPPFVLVAHDTEGKWDVYARQFSTPVASFNQRGPACDFATGLAQLRRDCLVLLREKRARELLN